MSVYKKVHAPLSNSLQVGRPGLGGQCNSSSQIEERKKEKRKSSLTSKSIKIPMSEDLPQSVCVLNGQEKKKKAAERSLSNYRIAKRGVSIGLEVSLIKTF